MMSLDKMSCDEDELIVFILSVVKTLGNDKWKQHRVHIVLVIVRRILH